MANHTFHLTRHANSPLYEIISSPFFRLLHLALICLSILLFGAGIGLASKYVPVDPGFLDLGISSDFAEKLAMGILFMSLIWSIFLLAWHLAKRPKIHPGYYIGFDFYVFVSMVVALSMAIALSATVEYDLSICDPTSSRDHQSRPACEDHVEQIKGLDITAYILAFLARCAPLSSNYFPVEFFLKSIIVSLISSTL